jgi:hypothetical protein
MWRQCVLMRFTFAALQPSSCTQSHQCRRAISAPLRDLDWLRRINFSAGEMATPLAIFNQM